MRIDELFDKPLPIEVEERIERGRPSKLHIEELGGYMGLDILINPTRALATRLAERTKSGELRVLRDPENGDLLVWDAGRATHDQVSREVLGKPYYETLDIAKLRGRSFKPNDPIFMSQIAGQGIKPSHPIFDRHALTTEGEQILKLPDIKVGDEVKIGRWKNRKATVKGFKKDKKDNHPILKTTKGDTKLFKPRINKIETNEAFDQPLPLKWASSPGGTWKTAEFKIDKFRIIVEFVNIQTRLYGDENLWAVTFGSPETVLGRPAKANVGHKTILIFSTVLKAIDEFFEKEEPDRLRFVGATSGLTKLYEKMIRYINSKGKYRVALVPDEDGLEFHYEITR